MQPNLLKCVDNLLKRVHGAPNNEAHHRQVELGDTTSHHTHNGPYAMYFVFDCTTAQGYAFSTPFKFIARIGSRLLTKTTGRVHDYENMATVHSDPHL